jgi:hypothetical protein
MLATVYQVLAMLTIPVATLSIGANLGLLHLLWMLVGSRLRARRGALLPGLNDLGLPKGGVRRAGAALAGAWTTDALRAGWRRQVEDAGA